MENTKIKTEYDKAVEFMKMITAVYDAIVEYKTHVVIIRMNGEQIFIQRIKRALSVRVLAREIDWISNAWETEPKFNGISKPLETEVLYLDFTV